MPGAVATSRNIQAYLNYHLDPSKGGTDWLCSGSVGEKRRKHLPILTKIHDIRGREDEFDLDKQGFHMIQNAPYLDSWRDEARTRDEYYPMVRDMFMQCTDANKVIPISHVRRQVAWDEAFDAEKDLPDDARTIGFSTSRWIHIDQSSNPGGAPKRIRTDLPEVMGEIEAGQWSRWAVANIWRPIEYSVTRDPLAVADARSIPQEHLVSIQTYFPAGVKAGPGDPYANHPSFEAWGLRAPAKDEHQWYYISNMNPEEALLFKIFDSKQEGVARGCPHTAFQTNEDHGPPRQSVEVRCLLLWK